jgi:hypothetical protein
MAYSLNDLEIHWHKNCELFEKSHSNVVRIFKNIVPLAYLVIGSLEGRRKLPENCTYLLLSKAINHSLSMYLLLGRGLVIDASQSARNAIETFLMIELFATDPTEKYFEQWAKGKEYKPSWVRNQLGTSLKAIVRDVEIKFEDDFYESVKLAYSFFSGISHSNLKSAKYSVRLKTDGIVEVPTGGIIEEQEPMINCLFAVVCGGLIRSLLISSAVFSLDLLNEISSKLKDIQKQLDKAFK